MLKGTAMPMPGASIDIRGPTDFALDTLADNLRPFVHQILKKPSKNISGTVWDEIDQDRRDKAAAEVEQRRNGRTTTRKYDKPYPLSAFKWSPEQLLERLAFHWEIMTNYFDNASISDFYRISQSREGWINDLYRLRNKWAHRNDYTERDALRFLCNATFLLESIGKLEPASAVEQKRQELERAVSSGRSKPLTSQLTPQRIKRRDEPEFMQFLELMDNAFPDTADPDANFVRWLDEREIYLKETPPCDDIFLVVKADRYDRVVAAAYASNYPTLGYLFISYVAVDEAFQEELLQHKEVELYADVTNNAVPKLLRGLLKIVNTTGINKGVVTEIAQGGKNLRLKRKIPETCQSALQR